MKSNRREFTKFLKRKGGWSLRGSKEEEKRERKKRERTIINVILAKIRHLSKVP